ncbi:MAG: class I SAM-dependent methyltransferase [Caldilineaceae bacterium]
MSGKQENSGKQASDFARRRTRFRQYESAEAITAYLARLEREWPERAPLAKHIGQRIAATQQQVATGPTVLELCCGPGRLATTLLAMLPTMQYTGLDLSPPFLAFAQTQLAPVRERVTLIEADLSVTDWPTQLPAGADGAHFDAIVSLQSLHDVGDVAVIRQIYATAYTLLRPGGCLLNADLIVAVDEVSPNNPGRLPIPRHLALLTECGYHNARCTFAAGGFGCIMGETRA